MLTVQRAAEMLNQMQMITFSRGKLILVFYLQSSQSLDLWLLERLAAVEQHVGVGRLHQGVLYLSDKRVVKQVPGLG